MPGETEPNGGTPNGGQGDGGKPAQGQGQRNYGGTDPTKANTGNGGKPADDGKSGSSGTGDQGSGAGDGGGEPSGSTTDDTTGLKNTISKLRDENKTLKGQVRELQPQAERDQKDLERLRAAEPGWQAERGRLLVQNEVLKHAAKLGFADPGDAATLLESSTHLDRDDEGKPTNVEAALKKLLADKPYLASTATARTSADGGNGARGTGGGNKFDMNSAMRRAAGRE